MTLILLFFLAIVGVLVGLLLWAIRPVKVKFRSADEVFAALSAPRDYYRLPQILQSLQPSDTEYLKHRGYPEVCKRMRAERKRIALKYLEYIANDYGTLIEASRMLAAMAPKVVAAHEWERLRLSMGFAWNCRMLRWRLRTGLTPWDGFAKLSRLAGELSYRLEQTTTRIGERAMMAGEFPSLAEERSGDRG